MNYIDEPIYRQEGNTYVLYKGNFTTDDQAGVSPNTYVGNGLEVGRFDSLSELQQRSRELFEREARQVQ